MLARPRRTTTIVVLAFLIPACAAHESVGRPPTAAELSWINRLAAASGSVRVDYVVPIPVCTADGSCQETLNRERVEAESVEFVGERLVIRTPEGVGAVPAGAVNLISVKDRGRGVLAGSAIGAGLGLVVGLTIGLLWSLERNGYHDPPVDQGRDCNECTEAVVSLTLVGLATGALMGGLAGSPRTFTFGRTVSSQSE